MPVKVTHLQWLRALCLSSKVLCMHSLSDFLSLIASLTPIPRCLKLVLKVITNTGCLSSSSKIVVLFFCMTFFLRYFFFLFFSPKTLWLKTPLLSRLKGIRSVYSYQVHVYDIVRTVLLSITLHCINKRLLFTKEVKFYYVCHFSTVS